MLSGLKKVFHIIAINGLVLLSAIIIIYGITEMWLRLKPAVVVVDENKASSNYYLQQMIKDPVLKRNYFDGPCRPYYRDYYYFSVKCKSAKINTTEYYDTRATPSSAVSPEAPIVWVFGGSTMLNLTASDELTIANQIAVHSSKVGLPLNVKNFGMSGFASSQELIKFVDLLRRVPKNERPSVVIFYDGYNDAGQSATFGPGNLQEDISGKFRSLIEDQTELWPSIVSRWISNYSVLWGTYFDPMIQQAYFSTLVTKRPLVSSDPTPAVDLYIRNIELVRAISKEFGIQPIFALQPMIYTKNSLTAMEKDVMKYVVTVNGPHLAYMVKWYELVADALRDSHDFLNLTKVLDNRDFDDFADHGHTAPETGIAIAKPIADKIVELLKK